jgi:carboxyl-terminal processing protease
MNVRGTVVAILMVVSLLIGAGGTYAGLIVFGGGNSIISELLTSDQSSPPSASENQDFSKIEKAYDVISQQFYKETDQNELLEGAIEGMVKNLEDPYSVYMDQKTAQQFTQSLESSFEGIGAEVTMDDGKVTIVAPFKNSPAEKAGLKPNDQIVTIDGNSIEGLDLYEAVLKIRGEKGTTVKLGVHRPSAEHNMTLEVTRDDIPIETVYSSIKEQNGEKVGIIEITSFSQDTATDFAEQLSKLEEDGIDGLVIDVRGNPGGLLHSVEEIARGLITNDKPIVQIEDRDGKKQRVFSSLKEPKNYPIVGLIDGGSASASEILAGALKEAGGYELVGETTFGKGTVQQSIEMEDGSNIKLTTFRWLTSDGNWINEKGIEPTIEEKQPDYFYTNPLSVENPLKYDMNNDQIKNAQQMLSGLGFGPGRTDGYFDSKTETAVRAFQNANDLKATGEIDEETAGKIQEKLIKAVRSDKNDQQMKTAIEVLLNQ